MIYEKIKKRRSIRKFTQKEIRGDILTKCVDAARLSPSGKNRQPLIFVIVNDEQLLERVFNTTSWAGYLPNYYPTKEEMPRAYVIILVDKNIRQDCGHDCGIAAMSISMVAYENNLGSCILGALDRLKLRSILNIPENCKISLAVALGYPAEEPIIDKVRKNDIKYWLDKEGKLHVPKRRLEEIMTWNAFPNHSAS
ncbi:MAG: nitroreductase family protein [Candidatus Bathyarchaeota archaeon]|nr:MAG: nitroreductase family protein [Candidatus Bathyarchaeota archaeon]